MTDNEIIKAFEDKVSLIGSMTSVYLDEKDGFDLYEVTTSILDLINRQKAEIERLKKEPYQFADIGKMHSKVKAEAIKAFSERLRRTIVDTPFGVNCSGESEDYKDGCLHGLVAKQHNILDVLDNLLKEMVVSEE